MLYAIWDAFLLADDHLVDLHIYFSVAFIIYNRRAILSTRDGSDLPLVLTTLNIRSASTVSSVFKSAAGLHAATPYAFAERVRDMLYCPPDPPTRKQLNVLESSSCVTVDGEDVIRGMYRAPLSLKLAGVEKVLGDLDFYQIAKKMWTWITPPTLIL